MRSDDSPVVPGGFVTFIVWQLVPGLRLGDPRGANPFWNPIKDRTERDFIRERFKYTLKLVN